MNISFWSLSLASLFLVILNCDVFAFQNIKTSQFAFSNTNELYFKPQKDKSNSNSVSDGIVARVMSSIPWFKSKEQLSTPQPDSSQRYHLRLRRPLKSDRRHATTRLTRFFTDMTFETAQGIVDAAIESDNGLSLIRVFNSINDVKYFYDVLRLADPPVITEIYDTHKADVIIA